MSNDGSALEAVHAAEHDEHGSHGGHGHDPNEGVVKGEPPTPAWLATTALIALVTALATVWLAFRIG